MKYNKSVFCIGLASLLLAGCGENTLDSVPELIDPVIETVTDNEPEVEKMIVNLYDGVVVPLQTEYSAKSYGTVGQIHVRLGDKVKAGDLLITLSSDGLVKEYNDLALEKEKLQKDIENLDGNIYGKDWTEKEINALIAEQKSRDLRVRLIEVEATMTEIGEKIENNKVYATDDGIVVGIAVNQNDTVDNGQKVVVTYSETENRIVSAIVSLTDLDRADHIYIKKGDDQFEVEFIENSEKYSYFNCPVDMAPGTDADVAVVINGDTKLTQEVYPTTSKAETVYTYTDRITVNSKFGGVLKFIRFDTAARVDLKQGDVIATYYEKIDELLIKDYELEKEYLEKIGDVSEAAKISEYIEKLEAAGLPTEVTAPYDGVCVSFDNYFMEKEIPNFGRIAKYSPLEGRMLSVPDTAGKFKYGQTVSVSGKVDGKDFVGSGKVVSVSKYDLGADYNGGKAYVILDKDSEQLYNSYNVFVTAENLQFKK